MAGKHYKPEEIVAKLRQIARLLGQGSTVVDAIRQIDVIEPGSSRLNDYVEAFDARFRDELLDGEIYFSRNETKAVTKNWRRHYNATRPHSALR